VYPATRQGPYQANVVILIGSIIKNREEDIPSYVEIAKMYLTESTERGKESHPDAKPDEALGRKGNSEGKPQEDSKEILLKDSKEERHRSTASLQLQNGSGHQRQGGTV
jgi:hypothetical protein